MERVRAHSERRGADVAELLAVGDRLPAGRLVADVERQVRGGGRARPEVRGRAHLEHLAVREHDVRGQVRTAEETVHVQEELHPEDAVD